MRLISSSVARPSAWLAHKRRPSEKDFVGKLRDAFYNFRLRLALSVESEPV
jgi:hypothetical protein